MISEVKLPRHFWQCAAAVLCLLLWTAHALAEPKFPQPSGLVNDFADVIPPEFEEKISAVTAELLRKTEIPVVVATLPDIGGADADDYANRLYEAWGIGKKGLDKGVLIFVAVKERKMRIEVGYGLEGVIPDGKAGEIRDQYMIPYLSKNQFGEGLLNGTLAVAQVIAKDAGVQLSGEQAAPAAGPKGRSGCGVFPGLVILLAVLALFSRGRSGPWLLLALLMGARGGGSRSGGGGLGGGFGGFGGGFGGFGGGSSGGGGAGGSF